MNSIEMGYFGNIWVRQNELEKAGDSFDGHKHYFDHVTLLVKGSVIVEVEGSSAKQFNAPTFIVIRKEHQHKITAITNDVLYYCVFALRNIDGEIVDEHFSGDHDPLSAAPICPSLTIDDNAQWQAPTAMPTDGKMYSWNEETQTWVEVTTE